MTTLGVKDKLTDIEGEVPIDIRTPMSNLDEMGLKRLARFLGVRPTLVWVFKWRKRVTRIESWCDTDMQAVSEPRRVFLHRKCLVCRVFSWTGGGNSRSMCGWTPQLELRLGADEGLDE